MATRRLRPLAAATMAAVLATASPALADGPGEGAGGPGQPGASSCDWPMYGQNPSRTMSSSCPLAPTPLGVSTLLPRWQVHTTNVVTATPSVYRGVVYVGDWNGTFYALDLRTGATLWSTVLGPKRTDGNADVHTGAYGTVTSSAAIAEIGRRRMVFVGAGGSLYALNGTPSAVPDPSRVAWRTDFDPTHPTSHGEVESSPVVWSGAPGGPVVFVGSDANQDSGYTGEGVWALRASTGAVVWHFNPESYSGKALYGCGNVWSSPALGLDPANPDPARRAVVYFGTADCPANTPDPSDTRWQRFAESITAVSALDGSPLWSYQAHTPGNTDDNDYGSSAQLFDLADGHPVVGEAGKDGFYAVVDRATGAGVWRAAETGNGNVMSGFALGGFIGATAVAPVDGSPRIFGGVAINTPVTYDPSSGNPASQPAGRLVKGVPGMRAFSGTDGGDAWSGAQPYTYGATSTAAGVVYIGTLDGNFRALDARTGRVLWAFPLGAPISSGAAIAGTTVIVGAGTSESDAEFKACAQLPPPDDQACEQTPLNQTVNPLGDLGAVWAFSPFSPLGT